jgi:peptidoglycan/LPS O-acetylase OafA/YrhL
MNADAGPRPFFGRVEALRGVCAAMVAGWHMTGWACPSGPFMDPASWLAAGPVQRIVGQAALWLLAGHAALLVFFAISGLVLRVSLEYGPQDFGRAALRFHIARIFRIYPISMFGMTVAALVRIGLAPPDAPPVTLSEFLANLLLLHVSLNGTLWAIQLEVVMAPLIVLLWGLDKRFGPRALVAVVLIATPLAFANWAYWRPLSQYFFAFVLGMLLPSLGRAWIGRLSSRAANWALAGATLVLFLSWPVFGFFSRFGAVVQGYAGAILLCAIAYRTDLKAVSWLDWPFFRQLGRASGSYYVLHMPLLPLIFLAITRLLPAYLFRDYPAITEPLVVAATLLLFAPVAMLSYRLVEGPGIALGRRIPLAGAEPSRSPRAQSRKPQRSRPPAPR